MTPVLLKLSLVAFINDVRVVRGEEGEVWVVE
jgi:hypothetical protein